MDYKVLIIFIDEIIFFTSTYEEHVSVCREVLQGLLEQEFYLKESNSQFFNKCLKVSRYIIKCEGLLADPIKQQKILDCPKPANRKKL